MRIIKPNTLVYLYKVLGAEQGMVLCSTIMAAFSFDAAAQERLLAEKDLWAMASAAMDRDEVLDWSLPKAEGEFLVYGACRLRQPERAAQVRVAVAEKVKTLDVHGDRAWIGDRPGDPEPFLSMPIDWRHAYGGPDFPDNPLGKGHPERGEKNPPLPNILPENYLPASPGALCPVAGFTALRPQWPERTRHFGPFDKTWLEKRWPYYPHGSSLEYCLTAPRDQRLGRFFAGDERVVIHNMHPEKPLLETTLPAVRMRLFLNRMKDAKEVFSERLCRPDTLWLFPEREAGILAWRNLTLIADEDAEDVRHVLIAVEPFSSEPLPFERYRSRLEEILAPPLKTPPPVGAPEPRQAPAMPPPSPENPPEMSRELEEAVASLEKEVEQTLAKLGVAKEEAMATLQAAQAAPPAESMEELVAEYKAPGDEDILESIKEMEAMVAALEKQTDAMLAGAGLTREDAERALAEKAGGVSDDPEAAFKALLGLPGLPDEARLKFQEAGQAFAALRKALDELPRPEPSPEAPPQEPPQEPPQDSSDAAAEGTPLTVEGVLALFARGESLRGLDLRGLDFSGRTFAGADFSECRLEGAAFEGAMLSGARFDNARLDKARFGKALAQKADFTGCLAPNAVFSEAALDGAVLAKADFTGADFSKARLFGARFDGTTLSGCLLAGADARGVSGQRTDFSKANLDGADLREAALTDADFTGASCAGMDFRKADAKSLRLSGAACAGARFKGATLHNLRADPATDLGGADFRGADLTRAAMAGACLGKANLTRATLAGADLSRAILTGARLRKADATRARFDKADLREADLTKLNGFKASFRKARLEGCVLKKACLYGAGLYKCFMGRTVLDGANLKRTLLDLRMLTDAR